MRHLLTLLSIGLAATLSGCHKSSTPATVIPVPLTYSIGGSVVGLSGTIVLQNNAGDNLSLSTNGAFTFSITLQPNSPYAVTILTQPSNQVCTLSNGSGTATASVTNVTVVCSLSSTAMNIWTWVAGANHVNATGVYGTAGTPAPANTPGARRQPIAWTDSAGNFWLFGGSSAGNVAMLNDLWEFSASAHQWAWQGGSQATGAAASYGSMGMPAAGNNPGAREGAAAWADAAGNLWLFGGDNLAGQNWVQFNDLWSYSPSTGLWTWVGGSNVAGNAGSYGTVGVAAAGNLPPARTDPITWVDAAGIFWLFGGAQLNSNGSYHAVFNDLWSYNASTGLWTWVGGSNTPNAVGTYGTQGVAAAGNVPSARMGGSAWLDASGNVWLFGGLGLGSTGITQEYSDLWELGSTSGQWTWVAGAQGPNALGVYGTQRAGAAGNNPGARVAAVSWKDAAGNFWLFGGYGWGQESSVGNLNDLWEYNIGVGVWIWIGGSSSISATGIYGAQSTPTTGNGPGAREQAVGWVDSSGNFWLFGGFGFGSGSSDLEGDLNDLWSFAQNP
ncbi:MAG TPA: kelch repeat-containing protein [Steroidobacteraceae bacterium]